MRIFKCVLLGTSGVGKSSIVLRALRNQFDENPQSTIGAAFSYRAMNHPNGDYRLEIWDTAGQERYESLVPLYYRDAHIVIIVYDVTDRDSFDGAKKTYAKIAQSTEKNNMFFMMIGNKCEYPNRMVDGKEVSIYCEVNNLTTFECSAKHGININLIFETIEKHIDPQLLAIKNDTIDINANNTDRYSESDHTSNFSCCR